MGYQTYNFDADLKKAGAKYDPEIKKLQGNSKKKSELAKLETERSKAIGALLGDNMKAIAKVGSNVYFTKVDGWLSQAQSCIDSANKELEKMKAGNGSPLSVETVAGGVGLIKSLSDLADKENKEFGVSWATYRSGNPTSSGVQQAHLATFISSRTQLMADSKGIVAKGEKIKQLAKEAEELAKTAKVLASAGLRDESDAIGAAKDAAEKVGVELAEIERMVQQAEHRCLMIKNAAADTKLTVEGLKAVPSYWKDAVSLHTQAKNRLKTIDTILKQAPDQIGAEFLNVPQVKQLLDKAKADQKTSGEQLAALTKTIQETSKDMAKINQRLATKK